MKLCNLSRIIYTTSIIGREKRASELEQRENSKKQPNNKEEERSSRAAEHPCRQVRIWAQQTYLIQRTDAWLEDHVGVEQKGAQEGLGIAG